MFNNPFLEITLLHELVHVRQISSGQLENLPNGWMWNLSFILLIHHMKQDLGKFRQVNFTILLRNLDK
jgi:hypothetical protein